MSGAELGDPVEWEGGCREEYPQRPLAILHTPNARFPEELNLQPLLRMVGEWPRGQGAVFCGSGWEGWHWGCSEPTVLSLLGGLLRKALRAARAGSNAVPKLMAMVQLILQRDNILLRSHPFVHVLQQKQTATITSVFS